MNGGSSWARNTIIAHLDASNIFAMSVGRRMRSKYVMSFSMNPVLFHSAEKTYDDELKWLKRKINEQLAIRNDGLVV